MLWQTMISLGNASVVIILLCASCARESASEMGRRRFLGQISGIRSVAADPKLAYKQDIRVLGHHQDILTDEIALDVRSTEMGEDWYSLYTCSMKNADRGYEIVYDSFGSIIKLSYKQGSDAHESASSMPESQNAHASNRIEQALMDCDALMSGLLRDAGYLRLDAWSLCDGPVGKDTCIELRYRASVYGILFDDLYYTCKYDMDQVRLISIIPSDRYASVVLWREKVLLAYQDKIVEMVSDEIRRKELRVSNIYIIGIYPIIYIAEDSRIETSAICIVWLEEADANPTNRGMGREVHIEIGRESCAITNIIEAKQYYAPRVARPSRVVPPSLAPSKYVQ